MKEEDKEPEQNQEPEQNNFKAFLQLVALGIAGYIMYTIITM